MTETTASAAGSISASKADNTGGSTTATVPGTQSTAATEDLAAKERASEAESSPDESLQTTMTKVKEQVVEHTAAEIKATATVTATTTTKDEGEGLSSVDEKSSHSTDDGMKTEPLNEKKDQIHTDKTHCAEG